MSKSGLSSLPDELLIEMVKNLSYYDFKRCCNTSKRFKTFCDVTKNYFCKHFLRQKGYDVHEVTDDIACDALFYITNSQNLTSMLRDKKINPGVVEYILSKKERYDELIDVLKRDKGVEVGNLHNLEFLSVKFPQFKKEWNNSFAIYYASQNDLKSLKDFIESNEVDANNCLLLATVVKHEDTKTFNFLKDTYEIDESVLFEDDTSYVEGYVRMLYKDGRYDMKKLFMSSVDKLDDERFDFLQFIMDCSHDDRDSEDGDSEDGYKKSDQIMFAYLNSLSDDETLQGTISCLRDGFYYLDEISNGFAFINAILNVVPRNARITFMKQIISFFNSYTLLHDVHHRLEINNSVYSRTYMFYVTTCKLAEDFSEELLSSFEALSSKKDSFSKATIKFLKAYIAERKKEDKQESVEQSEDELEMQTESESDESDDESERQSQEGSDDKSDESEGQSSEGSDDESEYQSEDELGDETTPKETNRIKTKNKSKHPKSKNAQSKNIHSKAPKKKSKARGLKRNLKVTKNPPSQPKPKMLKERILKQRLKVKPNLKVMQKTPSLPKPKLQPQTKRVRSKQISYSISQFCQIKLGRVLKLNYEKK